MRKIPAMKPHTFRSASEFDIETLSHLYARTFEGYVYKAVITPELLRTWIWVEDLKLELSPVLCVGDTLVGFATVGLRSEHAYCRGFGIVPEYRGQGLANALSREMVARAKSVGATDMVLGVLVDNAHAVSSYRASGFEPVREIHSLEWTHRNDTGPLFHSEIVEIDAARALASFGALHPVPPVWNRDLPSLEKMDGLQGLGVFENDTLRAYVLYRAHEDKSEILDLASARQADGETLLRALGTRFHSIVCYNEPEPGPAYAVMQARNFRLTNRRYEMRVGGLN